jgi:hypothetical protein
VKSKARSPSRLADDVCGAIKILTANRRSLAYATQWITVNDVQRYLGIDDKQLATALRVAIARYRLKAVGQPVHSVSLIHGWDER